MKKLSDLMTKETVVVNSNSLVIDAVDIMRDKKIGAVLVVSEEENEPVGIFTERDFLNKVNFRDTASMDALKVKDVMTRGLKTVDSDQGYAEAVEIMMSNRIRHLPVSVNGRIVGIISLRDMLEGYQEELKNDIQKKEAELHAIFEYSPVGIMLVDEDECLVAWNQFAKGILGMSDDELRGKHVRELYPPEEWQKIRALNVRQLGMRHHFETKVISKVGKLIDIGLSIAVLRDDNGEITGSIGIMKYII